MDVATPILTCVLGVLLALWLSQKVENHLQNKKQKRIKKICIYHLEKLDKRLKPTKEEDNKVFFSVTKLNEIKTAWYVYNMLLNHVDVFDPEKIKNTMEFFDNYSTNIEQIKSRMKPGIMGSLTIGTFENLKNYLQSALLELKK